MSGSPTVIPLPVVQAAALADIEPARRWLIEPLWASAGVGIVGGAPKCCKSWLALDIAVSVASATACLGHFPVRTPGTTLIYMAEDAAPVVKTRLAGICRHRGIDLAAVPILAITAPTLRLDLPADQRALAETVRLHLPRLLVLDPFVRLHRIDENDAGQVSAILAFLRALQREHDVAVLVVHHARKNGVAAQPGNGLRGSGDFHAWGDSNLYLRRQQSDLLLTIEHRASAALPVQCLTLAGAEDTSDVHLALASAPPALHPRSAPPADFNAALLAVLHAADAPLTRAALRAALRVRNARLGEALARLAAAGHVIRSGDVWSLPASPVPVPTP